LEIIKFRVEDIKGKEFNRSIVNSENSNIIIENSNGMLSQFIGIQDEREIDAYENDFIHFVSWRTGKRIIAIIKFDKYALQYVAVPVDESYCENIEEQSYEFEEIDDFEIIQRIM